VLEAERKVDFPIVIDGHLAVLEEASAVVWYVPRVCCFVVLGFVLSCGFHAFWCGTHIVNPFVCDWRETKKSPQPTRARAIGET
jgi:hypothetical protein